MSETSANRRPELAEADLDVLERANEAATETGPGSPAGGTPGRPAQDPLASEELRVHHHQ